MPHDSLQVPLRQPRRLAISGWAAEISATQNAIQPSSRPGRKPSTTIVIVLGPQVGWTRKSIEGCRTYSMILAASQRANPRGDAAHVGGTTASCQRKAVPGMRRLEFGLFREQNRLKVSAEVRSRLSPCIKGEGAPPNCQLAS